MSKEVQWVTSHFFFTGGYSLLNKREVCVCVDETLNSASYKNSYAWSTKEEKGQRDGLPDYALP